jgi:hypothetical protein
MNEVNFVAVNIFGNRRASLHNVVRSSI